MDNQVSPRSTLIVFVIVIIMIIAGGALLLLSRSDSVEITINPPLPTATPAPTNTPQPVLVYITGAVNQSQITVTLPHGSRVSDALEAAGGVIPSADLNRVNLAAIVRDGDQIHVPRIGEVISGAAAALPTRSGGEVIFINTATAEELQALPGIGPSLAQRIIDYRDANGVFASEEDLDSVSGVGPALLEQLAPLISFE